VIPEGGFEPYLSLFDASGNFLASTFFGTTCPAGANTNTVSGQCFDELLDGGVTDGLASAAPPVASDWSNSALVLMSR